MTALTTNDQHNPSLPCTTPTRHPRHTASPSMPAMRAIPSRTPQHHTMLKTYRSGYKDVRSTWSTPRCALQHMHAAELKHVSRNVPFPCAMASAWTSTSPSLMPRSQHSQQAQQAQHTQHAQHAQHAQHVQSRSQRSGSVATATRADAASSAPAGDTHARMHVGSQQGGAEAAPQVLAGRTVAVVGGGPGGVLCAAHLARLGAAVEVFEWRDPAAADQLRQPPAVWSIALGSCAKRAIEAAGLSPDFGPKWRFDGAALHEPGQPTRFFGEWSGNSGDILAQRQTLATQAGIVEHLQAECERVYGDAVRVHHGMRAVGGDVCGGEVVLEDAAGERVARAFDMVVGADGVGSVVRQLMHEQDKSLKVTIKASKAGIVCNLMDPVSHPSALASLPTPSGIPFHAVPEAYKGSLNGCAQHFFQPGADAAKGIGRCSAAVRHGGSEMVFTVTGEAGWLLKRRSEEEWVKVFEVALPQVPRVWLEKTAKAIQNRMMADELRVRSPQFITCSKLASGRALLLGDAAHAISPRIGMGCNAALQDSEILSRACIAAGGDIEAAAQRYDEARVDGVRALTHVAWRLDQVASFQMRYHRNVLAALAGLPYFLAYMVTVLPPSVPIPGILMPQFSIEKIFQEGDDWTEVQRSVRWYAARLTAVFVALLAALSALLYHALRLFPKPA